MHLSILLPPVPYWLLAIFTISVILGTAIPLSSIVPPTLRHVSCHVNLSLRRRHSTNARDSRKINIGKIMTSRRRTASAAGVDVTQILSTWRGKKVVVWLNGSMSLGDGLVRDNDVSFIRQYPPGLDVQQ